MNGTFGFRQLKETTDIDWLLENAAQIDSISAQILLREAYEQAYFIANHRDEPVHPWSLALHRYKEDYDLYGTLYQAIHLFRLHEIPKRWGYNLTEFLELPREITRLITHLCEQEDQADKKTFQNLKSQFEDEFDNGPTAPR